MQRDRKKYPTNCQHCGAAFTVPRYRLLTSKFCSRSCLFHARDGRAQKNCVVCGVEFSVNGFREKLAKYCSRSCYYKGMTGRGSVEVCCHHCGKLFRASPSQNRKFCGVPCINKSALASWNPAFTTVRKAMKKRALLKCCERCGFSSHRSILGVHHKDRNPRNNDLSNLEVLCPNCHSIEHSKHVAHGFQE